MSIIKFKVSETFSLKPYAVVVAEQLEINDFSLTEESTLGGYSVVGLQIPRITDVRGNQITNQIGFTLKHSADIQQFVKGQMVDLANYK